MKRILSLIVALAVPLLLCAQQKIEGFWGIPFMKGQTETLHLVESTKGVRPFDKTINQAIYTYVPFADQQAEAIVLNFSNGKFYSGIALLPYSNLEQVLRGWYRWKYILTEKYGEPSSEKIEKRSFIMETDVDFMTEGLNNGEIKYSAAWILPDKTRNKPILLMLRINNAETVQLSMSDVEVFKRVNPSGKTKEDF